MAYNAIISHLKEIPRPDPTISQATQFQQDLNPSKVNAGIGIIVDNYNRIWIPKTIAKVASKMDPIPEGGYVVPAGPSEWGARELFISSIIRFIFPSVGRELLQKRRIAAIATTGGTHAFSTFALLMTHTKLGDSRAPSILLSNPGYPNHEFTFQFNNINLHHYNHLNSNNKLDLTSLEKKLHALPPGTVFVLQGNAHNPSGVNFQSKEEWNWLAKQLKKLKLRAFFDLPYIGLGQGVKNDVMPLEIFLSNDIPLAIAISFSKTAGLYNHRVGALILITKNAQQSLDFSRVMNTLIRTSISTPPAFGQEVIGAILSDLRLKKEWESDLDKMRQIINRRRQKFIGTVGVKAKRIQNCVGLYSLIPFSQAATETLKKKSIYVLPSGRVNFGGVPEDKIPYFAKQVKSVLES